MLQISSFFIKVEYFMLIYLLAFLPNAVKFLK